MLDNIYSRIDSKRREFEEGCVAGDARDGGLLDAFKMWFQVGNDTPSAFVLSRAIREVTRVSISLRVGEKMTFEKNGLTYRARRNG